MAVTDLHFVTGALQPVKRGIRFLGGASDDAVQIDAAGAAMGNVSTKGTIAFWCMVPDDTGTYTAVSFGDADVVEYLQVSVEAGTVQLVLVDATTVHIDVNTPAGSIKPHKWHHVAVVQDGVSPKIYVDGVEQTLSWTTAVSITSWFKDCVNLDSGSIGAAEMDGAGNLT